MGSDIDPECRLVLGSDSIVRSCTQVLSEKKHSLTFSFIPPQRMCRFP